VLGAEGMASMPDELVQVFAGMVLDARQPSEIRALHHAARTNAQWRRALPLAYFAGRVHYTYLQPARALLRTWVAAKGAYSVGTALAPLLRGAAAELTPELWRAMADDWRWCGPAMDLEYAQARRYQEVPSWWHGVQATLGRIARAEASDKHREDTLFEFWHLFSVWATHGDSVEPTLVLLLLEHQARAHVTPARLETVDQNHAEMNAVTNTDWEPHWRYLWYQYMAMVILGRNFTTSAFSDLLHQSFMEHPKPWLTTFAWLTWFWFLDDAADPRDYMVQPYVDYDGVAGRDYAEVYSLFSSLPATRAAAGGRLWPFVTALVTDTVDIAYRDQYLPGLEALARARPPDAT
jgi:hypothetical protein